MTWSRIIAFLRGQGGSVLIELLINFVAPLLIYDHLQAQWGEVKALLASSAPPILWSLIEFARHRRVDAISVLVIGGIVLSLLSYLGGASVRVLQLRERMITALIGLVFIGSALIGRPLIYLLAHASLKRQGAAQAAQFEARRDDRRFKRVMGVMTLVWGFGLVADAALSAALAFRLSVHDYLIASPLLGYAVIGGLALWTFLYVRHLQHRGRARRAAEAATQGDAQ